MFTIKLSHISRARNVFFDLVRGGRPESYINRIEATKTEPAILLAKGLRDALLANHPSVKSIIYSFTSISPEQVIELNENKVRSLDEGTVRDILATLHAHQEAPDA